MTWRGAYQGLVKAVVALVLSYALAVAPALVSALAKTSAPGPARAGHSLVTSSMMPGGGLCLPGSGTVAVSADAGENQDGPHQHGDCCPAGCLMAGCHTLAAVLPVDSTAPVPPRLLLAHAGSGLAFGPFRADLALDKARGPPLFG